MNEGLRKSGKALKSLCWFFAAIVFFTLNMAFKSVADSEVSTIIFNNGDRLSGMIVYRDSEQLILKTAWNPTVIIPFSSITDVIDYQEQQERRQKTEKEVQREQLSKQLNKEFPSATVLTNALAKTKRKIEGDISVGLDAGFNIKERQNVSGQLNLSYTTSSIINYLRYDVAYGKAGKELSANRMDGNYRNEITIKNDLFNYNMFEAGYDQIREIEFFYHIGPGLGYRLISKPTLALDFTFGGSYQSYFYTESTDESHMFIDFGQNLGTVLLSKFLLIERLMFSTRPDDLGSYRMKLDTRLIYPISNKMYISAEFADIYDSTPAPGVSKNDIQIKSAIGYKF
ncbi:MAG: DUF481 domain-containing protein [Verrucomicrobiae bacterium]|nr:DUF481 domain-containing protein [Verrucomicrobiae bacterium]